MHSALGIDAVEVHKDIRDDGATPGCQMADDSLFAWVWIYLVQLITVLKGH
jgi:hypothetical protein